MTEREKIISENFKRVTEKIEAAKLRRGSGEEVRLLAATKTVPAEEILFAVNELGLKLAGENRQQEFTQKYPLVSKCAEYHFIGHLQTNKVKYIVGRASLIHSVDSVRLAEEINKAAEKIGIVQDILLEINIGNEESKSGMAPEEFNGLFDKICRFKSINVRGIMTLAPICTEKEALRKYFRETYAIFIDNFQKKSHNIGETVLSMGMSDSFEIAIEEGSNLIRVGSAIFGNRVYP